MRKKIIAGNWKMNTLPAEGVELAKQVAAGKHRITASGMHESHPHDVAITREAPNYSSER